MKSDKAINQAKSVFNHQVERFFAMTDDQLLAEVKRRFPAVSGNGTREAYLQFCLKDELNEVFKTKGYL